jgi:peptidoglycan/xylan/chitin deacetylase (PgdA/CDA1 family)
MSIFFKIIAYHSINDVNNPNIHKRNIVSPDKFEQQINFLANHYMIVSLEEIVNMIKKKYKTGRFISITFDDGYADFYNIAYPILRKYDVPVTIFLNSDYTNNEIKWDDRLNSIRNTFENDARFLEHFEAHFQKLTIMNYDDLIWKFKNTHPKRLSVICKKINEVYGDFNSKIMLSWDEIKELSNDKNIFFGAHTCSHANLTLLDDIELKTEVMNSKEIIESHIRKEIKGFCYPYGLYNERVRKIVKEIGFDYAVSCNYGINTIFSDLSKLKRILIVNYLHSMFKRELSTTRLLMRPIKQYLLNKSSRYSNT